MLKNGVVELLEDYFLAKDGIRITPDQSRLLKLFGCAIADFNLKLIGKWESEEGEYKEVKSLSSWDKRTYNTITVQKDDQKWEWLEDGEMKQFMKKSQKVESMDFEDEDENQNESGIANLF
jgi:hypothetical protein